MLHVEAIKAATLFVEIIFTGTKTDHKNVQQCTKACLVCHASPKELSYILYITFVNISLLSPKKKLEMHVTL